VPSLRKDAKPIVMMDDDDDDDDKTAWQKFLFVIINAATSKLVYIIKFCSLT